MTTYKVYFTPLVSRNTYGSEIEVSDHINATGVSQITRSIDAADYDVGLFAYGDITLKGINVNGYFNEGDRRSIFKYLRDKTKVRVEFFDGTSNIVFNGLINEEATRIDPITEEIKFRVLSLDSVIRNNKVNSGVVSDGMTAKNAIHSILNNEVIRSVLGVDIDNINPANNITIDLGTEFDNDNTRTALNDLLFVSNSVLIIDSNNDIIVHSRDANTILHYLYGKNDAYGRENIISMNSLNAGKHRMFNTVGVNGQVVFDDNLTREFGTRIKKKSFSFITDSDNSKVIARALLNEFKVAKQEVEVEIPTSIAKDFALLDKVSINFPYRLERYKDSYMPVTCSLQLCNNNFKLPKMYGSTKIEPNIAWKVIEIKDNVKTFTSKIKLREKGKTLSDGVI